MAKFNIIYRSGHYYFQFMATNGEQILASEPYNTKYSCREGIDTVKRLAPMDVIYDRYDNPGNYRFNMTAANNKVVARGSEGYTAKHNRDHAIQVVKDYAPIAVVYDLA